MTLPLKFIRILFAILLYFTLHGTSVAGTYWVSPTGTAAWADAESATPLSGAACASLVAANDRAASGDVVFLRSGIYADPIAPTQSGQALSRITWQNYNQESVVLGCDNVQVDNYRYGILLNRVDYHTITGLEIDGGNIDYVRLVVMKDGASHNEIANCRIHGGGRNTGNSGVHIYDSGGNDGGSTHNWIHDCTIFNAGYIHPTSCNDMSNLIKIGNYGEDYISHANTLENNVFYAGGHHILETYTKYNVIRNNISHNEGWMTDDHVNCTPLGEPDTNGKWGNRNFQIYDGNYQSAMYNLVEGNRLGHAGPPPDGNGAQNLTITSPANIIRYNLLYNAGEKNLMLKQGTGSDSDNNRIYNNTCYLTRGIRPGADGVFFHSDSDGNRVKNNFFVDSHRHDIGLKTDGNVVTNNWVTADGDPGFVNPDISDPMSTALPDLSLQSDSGAKDAGTHLTVTNGSGSSAISLVVADALYFQDGTWGSDMAVNAADWIAIGSISNIVQIGAIDYVTQTLTLNTATSWNDNDPVWLYRKSDADIVLYGDHPDIGAHEFNPGGNAGNPDPTPENSGNSGSSGCFISSAGKKEVEPLVDI